VLKHSHIMQILVMASGESQPKVTYTASSKQTLYDDTGVVSHDFSDGVGVIRYSSVLTEMPDSLKSTAITSVTFFSSISRIGVQAFQDCTSLSLTELPDKITFIDSFAFSGCSSLALTSLPVNITSIGTAAFYNCSLLALTTLPAGITTISTSAFQKCTGLTSMTLPAGITTISSYAFEGCSGLTSLTFLGTPSSISSSAFSNCTNLTDIYVPWEEGDVASAPWGATNATIHYEYKEMPENGLVYYHPLDEELSTLPTGQSITQSGSWTYGTVGGVPCATKGNGNASILCLDGTGIPVGGAARTLSCWIMATQSRAIDICGWGGTSTENSWRYKTGSGPSVTMPPQSLNAYSVELNVWHHYAAVYANGVTLWYVDGVASGSPLERVLDTSAVSSTYPVFVGIASWQYGFRVAAMRIYNRVLDSQEIQSLFSEFQPTALVASLLGISNEEEI